jgi:hypothetical protein
MNRSAKIIKNNPDAFLYEFLVIDSGLIGIRYSI